MKTFLDYLALTKPRLTLVALLPVALGFYLGRGGWAPLALLAHTLCGAAWLGAGANALNQYLEKDSDALMARTQNRPLPSGRMKEGSALAFGALLCAAGAAELFFYAGQSPAFFGALTAAIYVFIYTPMKKMSYLNTYVGAIPGALPCVIGWAASGAAWDLRPWILFAIFYVWQLPHFFAIAWLYREDYRRSELKMLPVCDDNGRLTSWKLILLSASLMALSAAPWFFGMMGKGYLVGAVTLGALLTALAIYSRFKNLTQPKSYALASIAYLIFLTFFMIADRI